MITYIVNEKNELVPNGQAGELCLYGNQVTNFYWKNSDKTNEAFIDIKNFPLEHKVYKTGDVCFVNKNMNIIYCGRIDNQVKIEGYRVELGEIEFHSKMLTGINNLVAIPVINHKGNTSIHLFVENYTGNCAELISALKEKLPIYKIGRAHV